MPQLACGVAIGSPFLSAETPQSRLVLLVLNYTLPRSTSVFWERAELKICADGGANRLYDAVPTWYPNKSASAARLQCLPDVIKGDLDSIRAEVATYYSDLGVRTVDLSADQDSTDLQKCLQCAEQRLGPAVADTTILAVGALGGRLDHSLSNINALYSHAHLNLVLCGDGSLVRLLPRGQTTIKPERKVEGPQCGVVALGKPATASSSGLKWNLDGHRLEVGGFMSTSNIITADEVIIECTEPLVWTTELREEASFLAH